MSDAPVVQLPPLNLFINNEWVPALDGRTFETLDPSTGQVICSVAEARLPEVNLAVAAAKKAFQRNSPWRKMDASARGLLISRLADLVERDAKLLAALESIDNGKAFGVAMAADVALAIKCFRYYAGWTDKICGKTVPIDGEHMSMTRLEPIGVCGQIIPWNFPLLMATWKLAPALAAGCVVVIKSAEQTPLSLLHLATLIKEVGFPPGVVNVLNGYGPSCGAHMVAHKDIDKIAFTGSTEVGKIIQVAAAGTLKNVTLELGGKSPAIVFPDANLDLAVETLNFGLFFNAGQACCASTRIFVHEDIYDEFVKRATARAAQIQVGRGLGPTGITGAAQGPQVDKDQFDKIDRLVQTGKSQGAKCTLGGNKVAGPGYFYEPTVFADVTNDMTIAQEEIFGPVMCILKFKDTEEVLAMANDTCYGLAAAVFSTNLNNVTNMALGLRAGTVWANCYDVLEACVPFGGFKQSGAGRELGEYGLSQYSEVKTITIALTPGTKNS